MGQRGSWLIAEGYDDNDTDINDDEEDDKDDLDDKDARKEDEDDDEDVRRAPVSGAEEKLAGCRRPPLILIPTPPLSLPPVYCTFYSRRRPRFPMYCT